MNPWASMLKFSVAPVYVPTGRSGAPGRGLICGFVASAARYNDYAHGNTYTPLTWNLPEVAGSGAIILA